LLLGQVEWNLSSKEVVVATFNISEGDQEMIDRHLVNRPRPFGMTMDSNNETAVPEGDFNLKYNFDMNRWDVETITAVPLRGYLPAGLVAPFEPEVPAGPSFTWLRSGRWNNSIDGFNWGEGDVMSWDVNTLNVSDQEADGSGDHSAELNAVTQGDTIRVFLGADGYDFLVEVNEGLDASYPLLHIYTNPVPYVTFGAGPNWPDGEVVQVGKVT
jgi:hypothetical protein